jgi:hypothetical protein
MWTGSALLPLLTWHGQALDFCAVFALQQGNPLRSRVRHFLRLLSQSAYLLRLPSFAAVLRGLGATVLILRTTQITGVSVINRSVGIPGCPPLFDIMNV